MLWPVCSIERGCFEICSSGDRSRYEWPDYAPPARDAQPMSAATRCSPTLEHATPADCKRVGTDQSQSPTHPVDRQRNYPPHPALPHTNEPHVPFHSLDSGDRCLIAAGRPEASASVFRFGRFTFFAARRGSNREVDPFFAAIEVEFAPLCLQKERH